jgi:hypothetical protein
LTTSEELRLGTLEKLGVRIARQNVTEPEANMINSRQAFVVRPTFYDEDGQVWVGIGKPTGHDASRAATLS